MVAGWCGSRAVSRRCIWVAEISADLTDPGASASATRYYSHADRTVATRTGAAKSTVTSLFADPQNTATHSVSNTTSVLTTRRTTPYGAAPVA